MGHTTASIVRLFFIFFVFVLFSVFIWGKVTSIGVDMEGKMSEVGMHDVKLINNQQKKL